MIDLRYSATPNGQKVAIVLEEVGLPAREDLKAPTKYVGRKQALTADEWSNMFGERMHAAVRLARS